MRKTWCCAVIGAVCTDLMSTLAELVGLRPEHKGQSVRVRRVISQVNGPEGGKEAVAVAAEPNADALELYNHLGACLALCRSMLCLTAIASRAIVDHNLHRRCGLLPSVRRDYRDSMPWKREGMEGRKKALSETGLPGEVGGTAVPELPPLRGE